MTKTNQFIEKARNIHGDKYDYSKTNYINAKTKVIIICPVHGEFLQRPDGHLQAKECTKCGHSRYNITYFIEKANKIHSYKYSYDKSKYVTSKHKILITCPIHGNFIQRADQHLDGHGCPECAKVRKLSLRDFITKANQIHNNKYCYNKSVYINTRTKLTITCPKHGDFLQPPHTHMQGHGCPKCGNNYKPNKDDFVKKFSEIHNNKYDYSLVTYGKNNKDKVAIICPIHGLFYQEPRIHLTCGCPTCGNINTYTKKDWVHISNKNKRAILYFIYCYNEEESFVKIGITSNSIKRRFAGKQMPYKYEVIKSRSSDPSSIYDEEKRLQKLFYIYKYKPNLSFYGETECFTLDIKPLIKNSTDLYPLSPF